MKKFFPLFAFLLFTFEFVKAQAPQATSYQAVIRNSSGNVLSNQLVKVRFSIHDSAENGAVVYQETQTPTTNAQGLINLFAGQGTAVTGTFSEMNWGNKRKFLQTEIDIAGGNNYTDMGTTQLMSVPYALYANNGMPSGTTSGEILYWNGTSWVKTNPGTNGQNLTICNGVPQWGPCLILPTVLTGSITAKTTITATAGGNVTDSGSRVITSRGVCFSTTINPTIANTKTASGTNVIGAFTVSLTGLSALTTYHYRAYATTSLGTSYGADSVFTTNGATLPTLTTTVASSITTNTATSGGNITSDGGTTITARGICWSTTANPTISLATKTVDGTGTGAFTSSITGLTLNTTYYVSAYATNSAGTAYGAQQTFTTASAVVLPSVTIGTQVWTSQNLSVARYRNGDGIPQVTDPNQWRALTYGAWCWYNNDSATYATTYGRLYNWYAVNDARGLAPQGWHVPSDGEWNKLQKFIDPLSDTTQFFSNAAGGAMKSTTGWNAPNTGATNSSGFAGLPGGQRGTDGTLLSFDVGIWGYWWSSTEISTSGALLRSLYYLDYTVHRNFLDKHSGFSVRCVKDTTPILTTTTLTYLTTTTATSGGNITSDGGTTITARGICWSTTINPTIALTTKTVDGTGTGTFTSSITGLTANTTYYVRAYATNSAGTAYGTQQTFTTIITAIPTVTTNAISSITGTTATSGGNITSDGGATITARGICWSTTANPTIALTTKTVDGTGTGAFTSNITGLTANTRYYVRAYATNSVGTAYGADSVFTTSGAIVPTLTTTVASAITVTTATSGGNITSDGGATITARGICWSTTANPTITLATKTVDGTGTGAFTSNITGLTTNTTYYVRAYATNSAGTAYGTQQNFTTASAVVLTSVTIGTQVWTTQNLSVARYRNGDLIPQVTDSAQWNSLTTGAWCWYNNDSSTYAATYGRLYNWYAVNDARGLAPQGWHVPSNGEWNKLVKYLDAGADTTCAGCIQSAIAGGAMKSTTGWTAPNIGATNSSGFAGLPGGYRSTNGESFRSIGVEGYWYSSTEDNTLSPWSRSLIYIDSWISRGRYIKSLGFSVRCVRD